MKVLEVIQFENDYEQQRLDEAIIISSILIGLAVNALLGVAVDIGVSAYKDWADSKSMKRFKPTGSHIPDETTITDKRMKSVYNARDGKWAVHDKVNGKWQPRLRANGVSFFAKISPEQLKNAIKRKAISFPNQLALLNTIQQFNVSSKNPEGAAKFAQTGTKLSDAIFKEEMRAKGQKVPRVALGAFKKTSGLVAKMFTAKGLRVIAFIGPVMLWIQVVTLKNWYVKKLNWSDSLDDDAQGFIKEDGTTYGQDDYDRDILALREMFTVYALAWLAAGGIQAIVTGLFWIAATRKNRIVADYNERGVDKKWAIRFGKMLAKGFGLVGKAIKYGSAATTVGMAYTAFNPTLAESLVNKIADFMELTAGSGRFFNFKATTFAGYLADTWFDLNYEELMSKYMGLATIADEEKVDAQDKFNARNIPVDLNKKDPLDSLN